MRGEAEWLDDGFRFVLTHIDGTRDNGFFPGLSYGLRLSVILYDSALNELIMLKKATDTKNFSFSSISKGKVNIKETSVKSVKDWNVEDKIKERNISVPRPAAG